MCCCTIVLQLRNITASTGCRYSTQPNKGVPKTAFSHIIHSLKVELCLIRRRQVVPAVRNTNQPFGFKCCCLHMASAPRGREERGGGKTPRRGIPEAPLIPPVVFPGCDERSLLVGVGSRHGASEGSSPRSDSATLDGVCLCPRDRIASACVWGTLSDDSVCVIYELWKGCISSTRGRPHGKWRNSEFINIQWMMINVLV